MSELHKFISTLGEPAITALLDKWERDSGIRRSDLLSIEDRWMCFMERTSYNFKTKAA